MPTNKNNESKKKQPKNLQDTANETETETLADGEKPHKLKFSTIKRMLDTLDRFLTRQLGLVIGICTFLIGACSLGLVLNGKSSLSAAGAADFLAGSRNFSLDTWLWSGIALFAFVAVLSMIYVFVRTRSKTEKPKQMS